ncbi:MAG: Xaa-Pro peptidase family protein [Rhodospirillales bacterium]
MAAFSQAEYRQRVQAVQGVMQEAGIDSLVVLSEPHICYLTGYEGRSDYVPQVAVLRAGDQDARLILREMDIHCAYPTVYLDPSLVEHYPERFIGSAERTPWEVIGARVLEIAGEGRIGVEFGASSFSFRDHQALVDALGGRTLVDASPVLPQVTVRKSPAEIAYMRQAAAIVDRALQNGLAEIGDGVRQCDVAARITHDLIAGTPDCGGDAPRAVTMPTGPGVAQAPHLKWTDRPFRPGDQTDFEVGGFVHRYCCALSRTVFLGQPPARLLDLHDGVLTGFEAALAAIRPGATCAEVHEAFAAAFSPLGIRKESRIGYSMGLDWSDLCFSLQADDHTVLETDYTLHLIIGIWEPEDAYVFSETIRVGEEGGESFSQTPRQLFLR